MPDALRAGVIISALFALVTLVILIWRTRSFGRRPVYSKDSGSKLSGVVYVFGKGMMPWEKESARKHPLTYSAGVVYHAGIFASLVTLFSGVFYVSLPRAVMFVLLVALVVGGACGLALLVKRMSSPKLRKLSCPDDYAANSLVTLFVILAGIRSWVWMGSGLGLGSDAAVGAPLGSATAASPWPSSFTTLDWLFYVVSIVMILYIPIGKIRHCFFFFYSRALLGIFFGRRSALPTAQSH